ncbi:MAG: hypothetical protein ACRYGP_04150 [Janthinobacterium lividum]
MPEHMDAGANVVSSPVFFSVNVKNDQNVANYFSVFQDPCLYTDIPEVHVVSLFSRALPAKAQGGQLTLIASTQVYAGVQDAEARPPEPGYVATYATAVQPISLAAPGNIPPNHNTSDMIYDTDSGALGLSIPENSPSVPAGSFEIVIPSFNSPPRHFNVGAALIIDGRVVLSNYVRARPQISIVCRPLLRFYVVAGRHRAGTTVDSSELASRSALCDFTGGCVQANITYLPNGSWDVQMT